MVAHLKSLIPVCLVLLTGCANTNVDKGGISSGGEKPTTPSTDSGSSSPDAAQSSSTTTTNTAATASGTTSTASAASGVGVSIASEIAATASGLSTAIGSVAGALGTGTATSPTTSASAAPNLICEAVISPTQTCKISNYGVSTSTAAPASTLYTSDLQTAGSVVSLIMTNSQSTSPLISNTSAAWCAVQTADGTFYQVTGLTSNGTPPTWEAELMAFLQLNCLSAK